MKSLIACMAMASLAGSAMLVAQEARVDSTQSTLIQETRHSPPGLFSQSPMPLAVTIAGNSQQRRELSEAIEAWQAAETEEDRNEVEKKMRELLEAEYNSALADYEQYLDELEARIEELREQVTKRREAQDDMVDLRLQMLVSEARGLGWPDDRGSLRRLFPGRIQWSNGASGFAVPAAPSSPRPPAGQSGGGVR